MLHKANKEGIKGLRVILSTLLRAGFDKYSYQILLLRE